MGRWFGPEVTMVGSNQNLVVFSGSLQQDLLSPWTRRLTKRKELTANLVSFLSVQKEGREASICPNGEDHEFLVWERILTVWFQSCRIGGTLFDIQAKTSGWTVGSERGVQAKVRVGRAGLGVASTELAFEAMDLAELR